MPGVPCAQIRFWFPHGWCTPPSNRSAEGRWEKPTVEVTADDTGSRSDCVRPRREQSVLRGCPRKLAKDACGLEGASALGAPGLGVGVVREAAPAGRARPRAARTAPRPPAAALPSLPGQAAAPGERLRRSPDAAVSSANRESPTRLLRRQRTEGAIPAGDDPARAPGAAVTSGRRTQTRAEPASVPAQPWRLAGAASGAWGRGGAWRGLGRGGAWAGRGLGRGGARGRGQGRGYRKRSEPER